MGDGSKYASDIGDNIRDSEPVLQCNARRMYRLIEQRAVHYQLTVG